MRLSRQVTRAAAGIKARFVNAAEQGKALAAAWVSKIARYEAVSDDLTEKKGTSIYEEMTLDPEIKAPLLILTAGLLSKGWDVLPAVAEGKPGYEPAKVRAEFVKRVFDRMGGSLDDIVEEIARDGITYGTAIAELNWKLEAENAEDAGLIVYDSIKPKDPTGFEFDVDDYLNVTAMWLNWKSERLRMDESKFIMFTRNARHGAPRGLSDLRAAYRWYWVKNVLMKAWAMFLEKYGFPTAVGRIAPGRFNTEKAELLKVLKGIQQETAIVVPEGTGIEFLNASAAGNGAGFAECIAYCDKQMVKSLIGQTLTTDEGQRVGSMALGKVHQDVLELIIANLRRKLEELWDEEVIRPLVDYNFSDGIYPNFSLPLSEKDVAGLSETIFRLISCEAVDPRESWIREYLGLPAREELPEPAPTPDTNNPGPVGPKDSGPEPQREMI